MKFAYMSNVIAAMETPVFSSLMAIKIKSALLIEKIRLNALCHLFSIFTSEIRHPHDATNSGVLSVFAELNYTLINANVKKTTQNPDADIPK